MLAACLVTSLALAQATFEQGLRLEREGKYEEAKSVYEEVLAKNNSRAEAHHQLGLLYLRRMSKIDQAIQHLERAVALEERNAEYHFALAEAYNADLENSTIVGKTMVAPKIRAQLELAVKYNPGSVQYREAMVQYYLVAPGIVGGSYAKAHEQADEVAKLDSHKGLLVHAMIYYREGKKDKSLETIQKAIALDPQNWRGYHRLCGYYISEKRYDEAIAPAKKGIQVAPNMANCYDCLGDAYYKKGMYDEAIATLRIALQKNPQYALANLNLARSYEAKGLYKEAVQYYGKYISLVPKGPQADQSKKKIAELSRK
jgi:tetratricopeptide (TPR) repeat protein